VYTLLLVSGSRSRSLLSIAGSFFSPLFSRSLLFSLCALHWMDAWLVSKTAELAGKHGKNTTSKVRHSSGANITERSRRASAAGEPGDINATESAFCVKFWVITDLSEVTGAIFLLGSPTKDPHLIKQDPRIHLVHAARSFFSQARPNGSVLSIVSSLSTTVCHLSWFLYLILDACCSI